MIHFEIFIQSMIEIILLLSSFIIFIILIMSIYKKLGIMIQKRLKVIFSK